MASKKRSLGYGFLDEVAKVSLPNKRPNKQKEDSDWKDYLLPNFHKELNQREKLHTPYRVTLFLSICLVVFFAISVRLFHLQIVKGGENRNLADGNRIQIKVIHAPRGVIFDRSGKVLAANSPAHRLFEEKSKKTQLISREEALELEVKNDPKYYDLEIDNVRHYPYGEKMAHIVGYVGEISPGQLGSDEFKGYKIGDRIGQYGIEAQYEKLLKGLDGGEIIEVDSTGKKLRTLRKSSPVAGQNIYLSIDASLQEILYQKTYETLRKVDTCCAAAIAMEPSTGQVLALVSFPSFDPNLFTSSNDEGAINAIFSDPESPILNRVIAGTYPPGSTFKIVTSLAALSSGKINKETIYEDTGIIYLGNFSFSNWYFTQYGKTEGAVSLIKAIQRSNDIYFYRVGQTIGEQALIDWSKKLMLNQKLGIDLPGEEGGLVPDGEWKQKTFDQPWYPGDTLHMAIGQGFVLTTPLQILGITSYIGANGVLYQPELLRKVTVDDIVVKEFKPKILLSKLTAKGHIETIKQGLKDVTKSGGTAWPFFTFPIETAGKTGTAEFGDPKNRTHAWYTSYAPSDNPTIAMTILIEGGGEGSSIAAPIAKEVYRWYFSEDKNKLIKDIYNQATQSGETLGE